MSKLKTLKNCIKNYSSIFDRIIDNYKISATSSLFHDCLEYKNNEGTIQISLQDNNTIKVLKKEKEKQSIEIITFEYDEIISKEKIKEENIKEEVIRTYQENELISLTSFLTLKQDNKNEIIIKIYAEKDKLYVNDRDISPLYRNYRNSIEKKYESLRNNYCSSKNPERIFIPTQIKLSKSRRQIILEEQIRTYIKEEFDYNAPLDKRNLDELLKILNMLIKRNEYQEQKIKQYKKNN